MNPWPPRSCTPSDPILTPLLAHCSRASAAARAAGDPAIDAAGGAMDEEAHALELDGDVGDREGDPLPVRDRLAECLALVAVRDHVVEHRLGRADRHRAPRDARAVDEGSHLGRAVAAHLAEKGILGHAGAVEAQAPQRRAAKTHRRLALDVEPRGAPLDDEEARAEAAHLDRDDEQRRLRRERNERLLAPQLPPAAVGADGAGARTHRVEGGPRLEDRQRRRHEPLAEERRKVARLLGARSPLDDRLHGRERRQDGRRETHVAARELFGDERVGHRGSLGRGAPELLGDREAGEAERVTLLEDLVGRRGRVVRASGGGPQDLGGEAAHRVAHHRLVLGRREIEETRTPGRLQGASAPSSWCCARTRRRR